MSIIRGETNKVIITRNDFARALRHFRRLCKIGVNFNNKKSIENYHLTVCNFSLKTFGIGRDNAKEMLRNLDEQKMGITD